MEKRGLDLKESVRIAGGVILMGIGIFLAGSSKGQWQYVLPGIVLIGVGFAILFSK